MPPSKKQKRARDSGVLVESSDSEESAFESIHQPKNEKKNSQKNAKNNDKDTSTSDKSDDAAPHDYICVHRPFFDVEAQNWVAWTEDPSSHHEEKKDIVEYLYKPEFEKSKKIYKAPASEHLEHKWVMMWGAWLKTDILGRKAKYCNPDNLGMYIYNDWHGWGMQEIGENVMIEFDKAFRSKVDKRTEEMWTVVSAMGLWLNEDENLAALINNEDGETIRELIGLIGCSLLTTLAVVEAAGELKPESRFRDLALVIAYYLELSHDLPAYGVEGECVAWRKEAVNYFRKAKLSPEKGLFATKIRIEKLEKAGNYEELEEEDADTANEPVTGSSADNPVTILDDSQADKENANPETTTEKSISPPPSAKRKRGLGIVDSKKAGKDPWKWAEKFKAYKQRHHPKMGGTHYDITKMSRADRAAAAFDGKDPLADMSAKDLKDNLLDFA